MTSRIIMLALAALLAAPTLSDAYNYWSITAGSVPAISPLPLAPAPGGGFTTSGATTSVTDPLLNTATSYIEYIVANPPGYALATVKVDGLVTTPVGGRYRVVRGSRTTHTIVATFSTASYTITTMPAAGGYLTPSLTVSGGNVAIQVVPDQGYELASVTIDNATYTSGAIYDSVRANQKYTFLSVSGNHSLTASFRQAPYVKAYIRTPNQTAEVAASITVDGSGSSTNTAAVYSWSVFPSSGASLAPAGDGKTATFSSTAIGTYTVTLTLTAPGVVPSSSSAVFTVITASAYSSRNCTGCHVSRDPQLVALYEGSPHYLTTFADVSCRVCHNPGGTGTHPFVPATAGTTCSGCHVTFPSRAPHTEFIGTSTCPTCHNPHSTVPVVGPDGHYNSITTGMYPASYVTSRSSCNDCHRTVSNNRDIRRDWAISAHADTRGTGWTADDFKMLSGCVQCHTTTGFVAYTGARVTDAWGTAPDYTKELLTCKGCHSDYENGILRKVARTRPYPFDPYTTAPVGKSDICMGCHSGRQSGTGIKASLAGGADFTAMDFIDPHGFAAAGTLIPVAGYHFPGRTYGSTPTHATVGIIAGSGPCISCHHGAGSGHTLVSTAVIPVCASCHTPGLADALAADKAAFANALQVLNAQLAAKGFTFTPSEPRFAATDWGTGQVGANTMGAAFNYALLSSEPGAFAHAPVYSRRLILDSVDFLDNGVIDGSHGSVAIPGLLASGAITEQAAQNFLAYRGSGCTSCHGFPPAYASGSPKANSHGNHSGFGCNSCHADTSSDGISVTGQAAHLNQAYDLQPAPGVSFGYTYDPAGGTCSAISCHGNGTATWGATLGCDGCHDAPPATASHLKHYGGTVAQAVYGDTRITQDFGADGTVYIFGCGTCHPVEASRHGNGTVEVELYHAQAPATSPKRLNPATALYTPGETLFQDSRGYGYSNGTCNNVYCHSYKSWATPTGVPNYYPSCTPDVPADLAVTTHYNTVTWGGTSLGCTGCHANPPRTRAPGNAAAAGDSHSWISPDTGWGPIEYMHTSNMMPQDWTYPWPDPISCMYCHNDTVRQLNTYFYDTTDPAYPVVMSDITIFNTARHVNGINDVAFEKQVAVPSIEGLGSWKNQKLTNAAYDAPTKTCSNVACHLLRTNVKWGTPYKALDSQNDCARCHEEGSSCPDRTTALTRQPAITSIPSSTLAAPGYLYSYSVTASEPGGGALIYTLPTAPEGMTISAAGLVSWTPRPDQLGAASVKIVVSSNASGGVLIAIQEFTITVKSPEPVITSSPVTTATAWKAYSYQVAALRPSGVAAYSFALTTPPTGMTINTTTGLISWTPTDLQVGSHPVTVTVTLPGYSPTSQSYTIQVNPSPVIITSTPVTAAETQVAYSYPVTATMAGATSFSYSLLVRPSGMTINASTGVISWTPTSTQAGSYAVTVQVSSGGYYSRQSFTVVSAASPITITSTPVTTAKVGVAYSYPVTATMPGGGPFTYSLTVRPTTAMTVSTAGVISWTPTATYVGTRAVTVRVTKGSSSITQSFNIVVSP